MGKKVSTLLFDLGGVILNLDYNLTIEAFMSIGNTNFESLYSQAKQDSIFDKLETGQIEPQEFRNYLRNGLKNTVLSDEEIDTAWNKMLLDLPVERIELLRQLKSNYRLLLFSNTNAIHFKKFQEIIDNEHGNPKLLESLFDKTYYSHILGERKPNISAFQKILESENLDAEDVIFIDDSIQHIEGARSMGIEARHLVDMDIIECCKDLL